eukprot:1685574-Pyramimonas_sp.AAC.1
MRHVYMTAPCAPWRPIQLRSAIKQRSEVSWWSPWDTPSLNLPGAHESGDSFADRSPPEDGEVSW